MIKRKYLLYRSFIILIITCSLILVGCDRSTVGDIEDTNIIESLTNVLEEDEPIEEESQNIIEIQEIEDIEDILYSAKDTYYANRTSV